MPKIFPIIFLYMFLCASNSTSFQAMYLKFAEDVDIVDMLAQIVYTKL